MSELYSVFDNMGYNTSTDELYKAEKDAIALSLFNVCHYSVIKDHAGKIVALYYKGAKFIPDETA